MQASERMSVRACLCVCRSKCVCVCMCAYKRVSDRAWKVSMCVCMRVYVQASGGCE